MSLSWDDVSQYSGPEDSLGFLFWRASLEWRRTIEAALGQVKLSHPQFVVLAAIGWLTRNSRLITQADICRHVGLDANTVSQILRNLELQRLITRERSVDERSKTPLLTEKGASTLAEALPLVEKADAEFFKSIEVEKNTLLKLMSALSSKTPIQNE